MAGYHIRSQPYCNRAQLYTVPVKLRSCRRLDEIEAGVRAPARFHPKENCIFLALLCSYPFAAPALPRSAQHSEPRQRAKLNTIFRPFNKSHLAGRSFCLEVMPIPCPHFKISIVKRSQGQSAVAGAAYQSGERLFSEYDQRTKFYNKKKELVHAEIMLPHNAPPGYADRATLWNAVEAVENQWNSQLARRIVLALPREVPKDQYLPMLKEFCNEQFVSKGMIADFAIHDKGDGNPHAHILLTIRAMDERGKWLPKARKVYDLDENGERIQLPSGNWKCHKENTVDWNDQKYAEVWRHSWETITNRYLEAAGRPERVDLRSFERQGVQQIPTVHLGPAAHHMEKRGIETFLGNLNRDIRTANSLMQSIRSTIRGLQRWIADLTEKKQILLDALEQAKEPTLSNLLVDYFNLRNEQRSEWSSKAQIKCTARDLAEVMQAVDYLKAHALNTVEDLNAAIKELNQTAAPIRKQLKQNENRMRAITQIKDAAAIHAKLKPIHDTFLKRNFKLTKDAYAAQHKDELDTFNKAVRTLMKLNGGTTVDFSALDAEFSALQSASAELRTQLEALQPDISALKNIRKYIDMVLNKQQLSAPGGKTSEKESVLKKLHEAKATAAPKKPEQQKNTPEL